MGQAPLIFDIQRSSFEDGHGIRTVVFFKGCPLRCEWCHNPESWSANKEILWYENQCKDCMACLKTCKNEAIQVGNKRFRVDKSKCLACGACADACNYGALKVAGQNYTEEELIEIILRDKTYYQISGGGVTFSGGEPLLHMDYLSNICRILKKEGIHIAIQTCGHFDFDKFTQLLSSYIDTLYFDIKIADEMLHIKHAKIGNQLILSNLRNLFSPKKHEIVIRTPLIPNITNSIENLKKIKAIIDNFNHDGYNTLMFNDYYHKREISGNKPEL